VRRSGAHRERAVVDVAAQDPQLDNKRMHSGIVSPRGLKAFSALLLLQTLLVSFRGPVKEIDKSQLRIETEQHEALTFRRTHKTKFLKDGKKVDPATVTAGTQVTIDAEKDPSGGLVAVNVLVGK